MTLLDFVIDFGISVVLLILYITIYLQIENIIFTMKKLVKEIKNLIETIEKS